MRQCHELEALLAPYIDGAASDTERTDVERHLRRCPPCEARAAAVRAARAALRHHAPRLTSAVAPAALHARCADIARTTRPAGRPGRRLVQLAAAALVVMALGGLLAVVLTQQSATVLAAQLTTDHVKCFLTSHDHGTLEPDVVRADLARRYGFVVRVPPGNEAEDLRLVEARRCLSGEGTNAHLLYRYRGSSVSLYVLPGARHDTGHVSVLGHEAVVWSEPHGTYVLVGDLPAAEMDTLAAVLRRTVR